ncbi:hypothetical protein AB1K62_13410 [Parasphingorhabdus sp. JC815]|uniref:hypothetical protein n=1 Tax=Parasphingorhabdus sp. JC815 TaxID=3232140 RepID=UPI00345AFF9E
MLISHVLPFVTRAAAAAFALLSIKLTYDFLSAPDFALLNYILFILAMSTALSSPIHRVFWAENSRDIFIVAVYSTCTVSAFLTITLLSVYGMTNGLDFSIFILIGCFSLIFASFKIAERYMYGQVIFDRSLNVALAIPAAFALLELLFVTFQYFTNWPSLSARLIGPSLISVTVALIVPTSRAYLLTLLGGMHRFADSLSFMIKQIFSAKGGKMLFFTIAMTLSIMIDRLILGYVPIKNPAASADYLLALSYAIAIQTFLNIMLDLGRKKIYQNMAWVDGAKAYASRVFMLAIPLALSLVIIFPALKYFTIVPASVSIYVWAVLILRSIAGFTINFAFIDSVQSGRISDAFAPILALVFISIAFLSMLIVGVDDRTASIICGLSLVTLSFIVTVSFYRRVPAT